ncbi:MAG: ATP-binding cassette domain-containing protein [Coriobacteriales bacterium]|jgi:molybdate transport system ATP-binding protein|nr:ATP-binding cassette domain-containing protein [Coriobacteriales bacterium]
MSIFVDISKHYESFNLDVKLEAGNETLGFLGASGCGKSLSLRCIAGLVTPNNGRIVVNDQCFFDSKRRVNLKPQKRKTALLFQDYKLFPNLSVATNIAAGIDAQLSKTEVHRRVSAQLERFGLKGFGSRYPARLSGGQQQRVALARMLAAEPQILMLDEPFSALDSHLKAELEENLMGLFEDFTGTVLYVSHDIDEAFRFCDRIAIIDDGHIVEVASAQQIVSHPQALATIKVSGVKNISRAQRVGDFQVRALDWGITLGTNQLVTHNVRYLGIRATYLRLAGIETQNVFEFLVRRVSDSRFVRHVMLDPGSISWQADKLLVPAQELPQKGQLLRLHFPPDKIYIVNH